MPREPFRGTHYSNIVLFLINLQGPLRKLHRDKFSNLYEQQAIARRQLEIIQKKLHGDPYNVELIDKEKLEREKYLRLMKSSLYLIKQ